MAFCGSDRCVMSKGALRNWLSSFGSERERTGKERKGSSVTVHDLSGSPVALASSVTPLVVASPITDKVNRSNPGSLLVLRPGDGTWKPWGCLETRRRPRLRRWPRLPLRAPCGRGRGRGHQPRRVHSERRQGRNVPHQPHRRRWHTSKPVDLAGLQFRRRRKRRLRLRTVAGQRRSGLPAVEVGMQHVRCSEDAAAFMALAAAVDLSVDACRLFSH